MLGSVLMINHYWFEVDEFGEFTKEFCSAYYGENDKPMEGDWVLVKLEIVK